MTKPHEQAIRWKALSATKQFAHRQRAIEAYRRAGTIRGAERLLEGEGAPFSSRQFVTEALVRAGVVYGAEDAGARGEPVVEPAAEATAVEPPPGQPRQPKGPPDFKRTESDDGKSSVEFLTSKRIRTLEDALAYAEVDTTVWRVKRWSCTAYETGMKLRQFTADGKIVGETPRIEGLWRVSVDLERILPKAWHDATEAIIKRMETAAPRFLGSPKLRPVSDPHLVEIDVFDVHFGKYAWAAETGQNYDLKIAERIFRNAVEDLVSLSSSFPVAQFVLPIGNDFYHVDNQQSATTKGTRVDSDGRYAKIIEVGEMAIVWAVEYLASIAPVRVPWIPGNHDEVASFHLARTIAAWFHNCPSVTVDASPAKRKYVRFGQNLIGYIHGDKIKAQRLPTIMAQERRQDWGETTCHEWRQGHFHRPGMLQTTAVGSEEGVVIRTLQSLSATDSWHHEMGFVGNRRVAEAYVSNHDTGYVGHFNAVAREE